MNVKTMQVVMMSLLLASVPVVASAQAREASWENLQQLRVGQRIQVVQKDLKKHNGTFLSFSEEAISLRIENDEVGIRRENVLRVSNRERNHRLRNSLIGAGLLGGLGLAIGSSNDDEYPVVVLLVPIMGGAGAALGAAIPSYPTIYRANN